MMELTGQLNLRERVRLCYRLRQQESLFHTGSPRINEAPTRLKPIKIRVETHWGDGLVLHANLELLKGSSESRFLN